MIITVFSGNSGFEKSILAVNLAALRARNHRHVLLVDADTQKHTFVWHIQRGSRVAPKLHLPVLPIVDANLHRELERLNSRCQDMVIDAGGMDEADIQTALIAARTVVVPVSAQPADEGLLRTAELLEQARIFNPLLRVLLVVLHGRDAESEDGEAIARRLAGRIPSSTIAGTVVHDNASVRAAFQQGLTIFEYQPADQAAATELESLGEEVYRLLQHSPPGTAAEIRNAIAALKRWHQSTMHHT
jgi:cellulose biosynthesis protein BcsQ